MGYWHPQVQHYDYASYNSDPFKSKNKNQGKYKGRTLRENTSPIIKQLYTVHSLKPKKVKNNRTSLILIGG